MVLVSECVLCDLVWWRVDGGGKTRPDWASGHPDFSFLPAALSHYQLMISRKHVQVGHLGLGLSQNITKGISNVAHLLFQLKIVVMI